ncbi:Glycosyltransferase involved in cell wall bisynthesis [Streptococcus equinus]|jgi:glycosyltransferase involved in cell wall biosynthesis|nr:Glycosyltransferase involved in cell wall bisynthesis [Streptococcus equinus]
MKRNYSISVAMATYNGELYIEDQLRSILIQLENDDEVVVSDDGSTDKTLSIIESFNDPRIKVIAGPKRGVKQNFANAIHNCKGKYIFLSDQDDLWMKNKLIEVLKIFERCRCVCVIHDCLVFDSETKKIVYDSFYKYRKSKNGILKNLYRNSFIGCCMAFDSSIKDFILPIPDDISMHDQWIGLICESRGNVYFSEKRLIKYRRHCNNVSNLSHDSWKCMILNRLKMAKRLFLRLVFYL